MPNNATEQLAGPLKSRQYSISLFSPELRHPLASLGEEGLDGRGQDPVINDRQDLSTAVLRRQ
jgi:hypothetical protein